MKVQLFRWLSNSVHLKATWNLPSQKVNFNSNLPPFAAAIRIANIRLAGDGDDRFLVGGAGGSSGHGHKGGDQKLSQQIQISAKLIFKN